MLDDVFAGSALPRSIIYTRGCVFCQALSRTHVVLVCYFEGLSVHELFAALFHAGLCGHEDIAAYTFTDVFCAEALLWEDCF